MKKIPLHLRIGLFFLACFSAAAVSCGDSSSSGSLVLLPAGPTSVRLGETLQLSSTDPVILWTVIGGDENGTIDAFGLYQAPAVMPVDPSILVRGEFRGSDAFAFIELEP